MNGFSLILILLFVLIVGGIIFTFKTAQEDDTATEATTSIESIDEADKIISLAKEYESNRQWDRAQQAWSHLIEEDPDRNEAYFRRGLVSYRQNNYEDAVRDFEKVHTEEDDPPHQLDLYMARAYRNISNHEQAFQFYQNFLEQTEPDIKVRKEIAELARELEHWNHARQQYQYLTNNASNKIKTDSRLALAEIALERDLFERLEEELEPLEDKYERNNLTDEQKLQFWYLKAKYHEWQDENEEADKRYRNIYQINPDFRDVREIVEKQISNLDPSSLVRKLQRMDKKTFEDFCQRIVSGMDYEIMETNWSNPEELSFVARNQSISLNVTQILFEFKKWQEQAGELAIKEFEFRIIENRYDQGFFVNPAGYKSGAKNYAHGHDKISLLDASEVIDHLKDWYQSGA